MKQAQQIQVEYCPYDGTKLSPNSQLYCPKCQKSRSTFHFKLISLNFSKQSFFASFVDMNIVENPPRKPRNFYEKVPAGIPDNHVDQFFLMGLIEKSSFPNLHYLPMVRQTVSVVHVLNAIFLMLVSLAKIFSISSYHLTAMSLKLTRLHLSMKHRLLSITC